MTKALVIGGGIAGPVAAMALQLGEVSNGITLDNGTVSVYVKRGDLQIGAARWC